MREKTLRIIKRYKFFIALAIINITLAAVFPETGVKSFKITRNSVKEMLSVLPPIFILLGLLDVWVKKETMVKYMGEGSGFVGVALAFLLGSAAAGPLYAAFPVALVLLKKGSKLSNVLIMLGAWSTTKAPLVLFEITSMGLKFALIRLALNIFGIGIIAFVTERSLSRREKALIYSNAEKTA